VKEKTFKGTLFVTKEFPRKVTDFLPIFEVLAPTNRAFEKLTEFIKVKLPEDGFPVKVGMLSSSPSTESLKLLLTLSLSPFFFLITEIPVFPTVTGLATFKLYTENPPAQQLDSSLFVLPQDFTKSKIQFKQGEDS